MRKLKKLSSDPSLMASAEEFADLIEQVCAQYDMVGLCVENERTGELSSPYLRFCCTTWGHFSKFNNSKVVGDIKMLLSSHKNLGKWWTFRVVFKCLCSLCSKWQHFEKKRAKIRFSALANKAVFGKVKNYPTLTKCCDQTTTATKILGIPLERQYPYLSFGT